MWGHNFMPMFGNNSFHGGFMFMFFWLIIFILLIYFVIRLIKSTTNKDPGTSADPMKILKERFARGEITEEEYLKMKKNLNWPGRLSCFHEFSHNFKKNGGR